MVAILRFAKRKHSNRLSSLGRSNSATCCQLVKMPNWSGTWSQRPLAHAAVEFTYYDGLADGIPIVLTQTISAPHLALPCQR